MIENSSSENVPVSVHDLVYEGTLGAVRRLVESKMITTKNANERDRLGQTILIMAAMRPDSSYEMVKFLLTSFSKKLEVNARDTNQWTALITAASSANLRSVELLLLNGADASLVNSDKSSALHYIVRHNAVDKSVLERVMKLLILAGNNINCKNNAGETALHCACMRENIKAVEILCECNADIDAANNYKATALHYAAQAENMPLVKLLLSEGASSSEAVLKQCQWTNSNQDIKELLEKEIEKKADDKQRWRKSILPNVTRHMKSGLKIARYASASPNSNPSPVPAASNFQISTPHNFVSKVHVDEDFQWCVGDDAADQFVFIKKLGSGGFGVVYKAKHRDTGFKLAIKEISVQLSETKIEALHAEIKFLKTFRNDNIVSFYGITFHQDKLWMFMECCSYGSVQNVIDKIPLDEPDITAIVHGVTKGLVYLHSLGIIHRDVKCGNILVTKQGGIKLGDFGTASKFSRQTNYDGTPHFMSPEALGGSECGTKTDVWSLGITCIQMAEGHPPLHEMHPGQAMMTIILRPAPKLADTTKWSQSFQNFVSVCLTKALDQRPESCSLLTHEFISQMDTNYKLEFMETLNQQKKQEKQDNGDRDLLFSSLPSDTLASREKTFSEIERFSSNPDLPAHIKSGIIHGHLSSNLSDTNLLAKPSAGKFKKNKSAESKPNNTRRFKRTKSGKKKKQKDKLKADTKKTIAENQMPSEDDLIKMLHKSRTKSQQNNHDSNSNDNHNDSPNPNDRQAPELYQSIDNLEELINARKRQTTKRNVSTSAHSIISTTQVLKYMTLEVEENETTSSIIKSRSCDSIYELHKQHESQLQPQPHLQSQLKPQPQPQPQ